jgi:hypothetical protein
MSQDPIMSGDSCHLSTTAIEIWLSAVVELLLVFVVHVLETFPVIYRFTNALAGQAVNDIIQRTAGRLETLHSEGVHVWRYLLFICFSMFTFCLLFEEGKI